MNEQLLKKFTSRCGIQYDSDDGADDESLRKYTELIVRECAQFVEDKFDFIGEEIIVKEKMLGHFGVEE